MQFLEKIKTDDSLTIFTQDDKGNVSKKIIKKFWKDMTLIEKILHITGIRRRPGTVNAFGKEMAARLYGNATGKYIDRMVTAGVVATKTCTATYSATGIIKFTNVADPWSTQGAYTSIGLCNNVDTGTPANHHVTIAIPINTTATALTWWAEVAVTFA